MQTVLLTPVFLADAAGAGLSDDEVMNIVAELASNPLAGTPIPGTGGARKVRFPAPGRGKSGGYRTVHYFGGDDVPVFLLALISKSERADLSQAERNALRKELQGLADDYRRGVQARVHPLTRRKDQP